MEMLRAEHLFPGCRVQVDERWRVVAAVEFPDPDHVRFCVGQAWFSCGLSVEWRAIVPNARLWFWWNGWVKLTIRPEKSLQFGADSDEYGENPPRANWVTLSRCQRDHYAEAMGY
jgi:hypothetical protein